MRRLPLALVCGALGGVLTVVACGSMNRASKASVGTSVSDTRGCGPGSCTSCALVDSGACGVPQLDLWTVSTNCSGAPNATVPADGVTCASTGLGNGITFTSAQYTIAQSGGACAYTGGSFGPTGSLSLTSPITLCCQP